MYERIIEIIVFVIGELRQNKNINEIDFNELQDRGYTKSEISTAFSWLVDRLEFVDKVTNDIASSSSNSFRILHDVEKNLFAPEAWGELIQLNTLGIVSNEHIEMLIERSLMMGIYRIDSQQLKSFVANVVFNLQTDSMNGNRVMLNGSDTIN